jgi:hypothetical protein
MQLQHRGKPLLVIMKRQSRLEYAIEQTFHMPVKMVELLLELEFYINEKWSYERNNLCFMK